MRWLIAPVVLAFVASLAGAPVAGANGWSKPIRLEPTPPGFDTSDTAVRVAANARGDAIAVWVRARLSDQGVTCCDDERVIASYRPAGGAFGKPETISRLGHEATEPDMAIDPVGNAFVAWTIDDTLSNLEIAPGGVGVAIRRAGARHFNSPRLLSSSPGDRAVVTAGAVGQAVVAWQKVSRPTAHDLLYPRRVMAAVQAGPARFSRPMAVSGANAANNLGDGVHLPLEMFLHAAADRTGATYLAWARSDGANNGCCRALEVSRRPAGGKFEQPAVASNAFPAEPEDQPFPTLASGEAGALLAWMEGSALVSRDWPAGQPLSAPAKADEPSGAVLESLAIARDGEATTLIGATENYDTLGFGLYATRRPPGGAFGPLEKLAPAAGEGALAIDSLGSAHAVWTRYTKVRCDRADCSPAGPRVDAAHARPGQGFGNSRIIGPRDNAAVPSIAAVARGAVAGWLGDSGPWVSALGPQIGRAPVIRAMRGPRVRRFAKHGRRTFTFRLSRPARVLIDITRVVDGEEVRRIGQVTVKARRGPGQLTLPRRMALSRRRSYDATLIAQDASGHDSLSLLPVFFHGG